jgi:cyclohexanone monooxygenase
VEVISRCIEKSEKSRRDGNPGVMEALPEAEEEWAQACELAAEGSLFKETASWIFGSNIVGKKYAMRFYFGGLAKFYQHAYGMMKDGFRGFKLATENRQCLASKACEGVLSVAETEPSSIAE